MLRKILCAVFSVGALAVATALADETLPTLTVGDDIFTNVVVTKVTETDIYFSHALGMSNAKLKNLSPDLQKHFHYNAARASEAQRKQWEASAQYRQEILARKAAVPPRPPEAVIRPDDGAADPVAPTLHAKSFRGQPPPPLIVDQWVTPAPDMNGKFVLVDFWATWCGPCRQSIPHLNRLQAKFKDRLVVVGLSDEAPDVIRKMNSPQIQYSVGTDTHRRTISAVGVTGIPHTMLIDPRGIVRFEGMPSYLDENGLARLLARYSN